MSAPSPVRVQGLVKRFGALTAVDGLDLEVRAGECFGLLGPNGAGKTTTMEILEGLQTADAGAVEVLGLSWTREADAIRERIGVQLQETQLYQKMSVVETLSLFRSFYRSPASLEDVIAAVDLGEKRHAWVGKLSGGQRQRLAVGCCLVSEPELLFFDEPTTGLDPTSRRQLWDILTGLRARGRTILLTTHYMEEAERLCDRVAIVDHGKVIALGTPGELVASLGGEQIIELAATPALGDDGVAGLPGVVEARHGPDGGLRLAVRELHKTLPALLERIAQRGATVTRLLTRQATLEDVFLHLTGHGLGDEEAAE